MLVGFAAASASGMAMVLFYLVAYVFGNMGAFLVVEAVARSERSEATVALRGLAQRSPCSRWRCCSSCSPSEASRSWPASGPSSTCSMRRGRRTLLAGARRAVLTVVALFYYLWSRSGCNRAARPRCGSDSPVGDARPRRHPLRARRGGARVYPKPIVMAALRIATPLF